MRAPTVLALGLALVAAAGCTAGPRPLAEDPELQALKRKAEAEHRTRRLAIAPVERAAKSYDLDERPGVYGAEVDPAAFQKALGDALEQHAGFGKPALVKEKDLDAALAAAHAARADVLVVPRFAYYETYFDGRNWLWPFNLAVWFYGWVPAWLVPDEDYGARARLDLAFHSVASGRLLYTTARSPSADEKRSLNSFERGWSFFGIFFDPKFITPDDMRHVGEVLNPHVERELLKRSALEVGGPLAQRLAADAEGDADPSVFALVVGISKYADGAAIDPAEGAAGDAAAMAELLPKHLAIPARNVVRLVDGAATRAAILAALEGDIGRRARPQDTVLVYFAGSGAAGVLAGPAPPRPRGYLLPHDASAADLARTGLALDDLVAALRSLPARRALAILDASFANGRPGHARSVRAGPLELAEADLAAPTAPLGGKEVQLLVAGGPDEPALELPEAKRGLFSYFLVEGAAGAAAAGPADGGRVSLEELAAYVARLVPAQAGLEGAEQTPRLYRAGKRVMLGSPAGEPSWLPDLRKGT